MRCIVQLWIQQVPFVAEFTPTRFTDYLILLGRILIACRFISSAIIRSGLWNPQVGLWFWTIADFNQKGIPYANIALVFALIWQFIAGLLIALGFKTRIGCIMAVIFVVGTNVMFHRFWAGSLESRLAFLTQFMKDLAIIGGVILVYAVGPGRCSLDRRFAKTKPNEV